MNRIDSRLALRKALGAVLSSAELEVQNREWLYMLQEETRHSLSIEGYFATEEELEAVLQGRKSFPEILNYYRAAQFMYDLALQYSRDTRKQAAEKITMDISLIRHVHSMLFRHTRQDKQRGAFRTGAIIINQAKVKPPEHDVADYVQACSKLTASLFRENHVISALAKFHTLFESIHPFADGNGRVGRILLNFVAITMGLPPIIIKGIEASQRTAYYHALEQADKGFHQGFPKPDNLVATLNQGDFAALEALLIESIVPQLDRIIILTLEQQEKLQTLDELAPHFQVQASTLRKWIARDKLLAIKRNNKLFSHPKLVLEHR